MKQLKFSAAIPVAVSMLFSVLSCNSGNDKKTEDATTTTADTTVAKVMEPPPASKPGNVLIIQHKVANFDKWKVAYESHDSIRRSYGLANYILGRGLTDPNMVVIMLKMADADKAKELTASAEMKERMKTGGVTSVPTFTYLDVVMNDSTPIAQTARLMMTHKVKDWDAWKKEFDSHKQVRMDAGLMDRGLGYAIGDNHSVGIVFAVTDMKKAEAFLKSPDLKDKMAKAGVEGPPTAFFYNIVKKY
ncbi:MAG: hypothetical protein ABJA37_03755 [Ferruginibacter sp.]